MSEHMDSSTAYLVVCPECEKPVTAELRGSMDDFNPEHGPPRLLELLRCRECHQGILTARDDYGGGWSEIFRLWPSRYRPLSTAVPETLRREHEEARKCYEARAFTASVVMVRRTLEGVCVETLGNRVQNLMKGLADLQQKNLIDGRLFDWAQALRVLGNEGAHYTGQQVSREDSADALAFSEALLDYMYVLTAKFQEFMSRRQPNQQGNSGDEA